MTVLESLIELQEVDERIRELETELKDLPNKRALEVARLKGARMDLDAAKAGLDSAESRIKEFETTAQTLKDKIHDLKISQASLTSNKEYQQYSIQIDMISHDLEVAENNQISSMDALPSAQARVDEAQKRYDTEKEGIDSFCSEIDERIKEAQENLNVAKNERTEKLKNVKDPKFLLYYERIRTKRWPAIVPLNHDGVCDGCHLVQPPSVAQLADANLRNGENGNQQRVVACTMCGRILYR